MNEVVPEEAIRKASQHGWRNAAVGLPPPPPFTPRYGSDEWHAEQRASAPRPERQRPTLAAKRDPDAPVKPRVRKSRAKAAIQQEAA